MKKSNNTLKNLVVLVLLLTMIALISVSGTFAKYVSEVTGQDTAVIAKWNVKLNGTKITDSKTVTFDLFNKSNIYELKGVTDFSDSTARVADADVKNTSEIIAPGTWGVVSFKINNDSDVTINYDLKLKNIDTKGLPLMFSIDSGKTWYSATDIATHSSNADLAINAEANLDIMWKWDFESGKDEDETKLALNETENVCSVTADIIFTQVD